jgi:hypothetical protein
MYTAEGPFCGERYTDDRMRFQEKKKPWNNFRQIAADCQQVNAPAKGHRDQHGAERKI